MTLEETQDKEDLLIIMMLKERDKQINSLETENANLKMLLIDTISENNHLLKVIKKLKRMEVQKIEKRTANRTI